MKPKEVNYAEVIELLSIKVLKGNISCPDDFNHENLKGFKSHFEFSSGIDIEAQKVRYLFNSKFIGINEADEELLLTAEYTFEFVFKIENIESFLNDHTDQSTIKMHQDLAVNLISIVYSTSRGMILARTQGTVIANGIITPVLDPRIFALAEHSKTE